MTQGRKFVAPFQDRTPYSVVNHLTRNLLTLTPRQNMHAYGHICVFVLWLCVCLCVRVCCNCRDEKSTIFPMSLFPQRAIGNKRRVHRIHFFKVRFYSFSGGKILIVLFGSCISMILSFLLNNIRYPHCRRPASVQRRTPCCVMFRRKLSFYKIISLGVFISVVTVIINISISLA